MRDTCRAVAAISATLEDPARPPAAAAHRERLLAAAAEILADSGYASISAARICERAGLPSTAFSEQFTDREDCFLALFEQAVGQATAAAVQSCDGAEEWRDQVRSGLAGLLWFLDSEPELASLAVIDALGTGPRVLARRAQVLDLLAAVVADGTRETPDGEAPPPLTADVAVGGAFSVIHTHLLDRDPRPLLGLLAPLMSTIVAPYLGPAAAAEELSR